MAGESKLGEVQEDWEVAVVDIGLISEYLHISVLSVMKCCVGDGMEPLCMNRSGRYGQQ